MSAKQERVGAATLGLTKWLHAMFYAGTLVVGWLFVKIIETTWTALNLTFVWAPPPKTWVAITAGSVGAIALALYLWRHPKVSRLSVEIVTELSKVTWPTRKELSASTVVVIVLSVIAATILWLFDFFWAWTTDLIYL
ncbi:MAG: preprotein translocase subunit SecE [Myxococcota bacterium]|nr:preprotein translocase subunit SecE [Myxococcota bacterium]